jgi:hypothetical protein
MIYTPPRDSRADLHSSGETASNFSRSSTSSKSMLCSLHSTREQLCHHSKSHQWGTHATTMGRLGTLPRIATYQGRQTHLVLQRQWPTSRRDSRRTQRSDLATATTLPWMRYPWERKSLRVRSFSMNTPSLYCLISELRIIS